MQISALHTDRFLCFPWQKNVVSKHAAYYLLWKNNSPEISPGAIFCAVTDYAHLVFHAKFLPEIWELLRFESHQILKNDIFTLTNKWKTIITIVTINLNTMSTSNLNKYLNLWTERRCITNRLRSLMSDWSSQAPPVAGSAHQWPHSPPSAHYQD